MVNLGTYLEEGRNGVERDVCRTLELHKRATMGVTNLSTSYLTSTSLFTKK